MSTERYSLIEHILFPPTRVNKSKLRERLRGKTVLITGASYGIGEGVAYKLAALGANMILVARTEERLMQVREVVHKMGGEAAVFPTDLSKEEEVRRLIDQLQQVGQIDIVVNNAGKSIRRPLYESLERYHDFTRTMNINYLGPVQLLLGLIPMLERSRGHIINVSAINVLLAPAPYWAAYQSSKTAFDQWLRCAAPELRVKGVATTSIYFPLVRTRMIVPTALYTKMPAMSPEHAARKICKAICNKQRKIAPWWLIWGQLASVVFRGVWERLAARYLKK